MARGGESSKMAAGMKKLPGETTDQKWRRKNLYMKYTYGSWIWGIKAFEDKPSTTKVFGYDVVSPKVICDQNYLDRHFPIGNGFFKFRGKIYLVGGETAGHKPWGRLLREVNPKQLNSLNKASDKVYEFDPRTNTLKQLHDLALPLPMPSPIVEEIKGKIYVLCGDFYSSRINKLPAKNPDKCFQVLELDDDRNPCWRSLPPPPFYQQEQYVYTAKSKAGVIGQKMYVADGCSWYSFDSETKEWKSDRLQFFGGGKSLLRRLMMDPQGKEEDNCLVIVYGDLYEMNVYVTLSHGKTGHLLHTQMIPEAYPYDLPFSLYQVVEIEDDDDDDQQDARRDAAYPSCTFSFVCTGHENRIGVSVLRISLVAAETTDTSSFRWGNGRLTLKV